MKRLHGLRKKMREEKVSRLNLDFPPSFVCLFYFILLVLMV